MQVIKKLFWILWRAWFFVWLWVTLFLLSPFFLFSVLSEKFYFIFFKLFRIWAIGGLWAMGFYYRVDKDYNIEKGKSYVFISNHTSFLDVFLMVVAANQPFVFVGKKSLSKIPLFGFFYKRTSILVDRNSSKSRIEVFDQAKHRINQGLSICIFPEGGVPKDESILLDTFKEGAFRLALEHGLPIVPFTFPDNKKRMSYTLFSGSPGIMRVKIHKPIETKGKTMDTRKELISEARNIIYNQLLAFGLSDPYKN